MPNYGIVVTPEFRPMSYEQYAKPFEDYAKVYNTMADAYDTLEMEANQWEKLANSAIDAPQYAQYKRYADDLRAAADDLATNGLNTKTRGTLSNLRKRYTGEIKPIADAYEYRQKLAEEQRKLNPKGDLQYTVDFSNIGLGQIMQNPNLGYSSRSLSEMEQEGFEQAKAASTRKIVSSKASNLGNQYYQILQGYGKEAAQQFLNDVRFNNPSEYQELVNLYNQIRKGYGTTAEDSPYTTEQNALADERILNGMMKGLALQDSYQTNHWALPGAGGSGNQTKITPEYIGYETVTKDSNGNVKDRYTVINEAGVKKYYKHNADGTVSSSPVTDATELKALEKSPIEPRYYTMPHNNNADLVYVVDANTGMNVAQNGNIVTYNRKTQRWNSLTKKVEDIETTKPNSKRTVYKLRPGQVSVSRYTKDGEIVSVGAITSEDNIPTLISNTIRNYDGSKFTENGWENNPELVEIWNQLDPTVQANPEAYTIVKGRISRSHDRAVIAYPKQNYSTEQSTEQISNESEEEPSEQFTGQEEE